MRFSLLLLPEQDIVIAMTVNTIGDDGSGPLTRVVASIARAFLDFENDSGAAAPEY